MGLPERDTACVKKMKEKAMNRLGSISLQETSRPICFRLYFASVTSHPRLFSGVVKYAWIVLFMRRYQPSAETQRIPFSYTNRQVLFLLVFFLAFKFSDLQLMWLSGCWLTSVVYWVD